MRRGQRLKHVRSYRGRSLSCFSSRMFVRSSSKKCCFLSHSAATKACLAVAAAAAGTNGRLRDVLARLPPFKRRLASRAAVEIGSKIQVQVTAADWCPHYL